MNNDKHDNQSMQLHKLKKSWDEEQIKIAAKVIKLPNDDSALSERGFTFLSYSTNNEDINLLGGVDVSFFSGKSTKNNDNTSDSLAVAVYVVMRGETIVYQDSVEFTITVPYVSSYLAFREIEPLTQLVMKQKALHPHATPEVILVDGNGIFHERGAGIASFLGVHCDMKTIGVGKTLYCMDGLTHLLVENGVRQKLNEFLRKYRDEELSRMKSNTILERTGGDTGVIVMADAPIQPDDSDGHKYSDFTSNNSDELPLFSHEENIEVVSKYCDGFAVPLRGKESDCILAAALLAHGGKIGQRASAGKAKKGGTKTKIPIFISIGHGVSLHQAIKICTSSSYARIPEAVRIADLLGREIMRGEK